MKILLLITDLEIGGTPTVVRELAIRLPADVACLAPEGPVADQIRAAGRRVTTLRLRNGSQLPLAVSHLHRLIHENNYDTVFSFLLHANTVAALAAPFCRDVRFIQSIQTTQPTPRWHWKLQSIVHHAADTIVVPSPSTARAAMEWSDIPPNKIAIIANAVDPCSTGILPVFPPTRIGFIGRLDPIKRIGDLINAIAALDPRYRLDIFGEGQERSWLEQQITHLHLADRVTLHGAVERPQLALNQIDILVLPSAAEGFGLVLIEAMAAGIPVIATDVPGIRDVVTHNQTGLLVPVASPSAIAGAINQIAGDEALRSQLIAAGLVEVKRRFSWERVLPLYLALLGKRLTATDEEDGHR